MNQRNISIILILVIIGSLTAIIYRHHPIRKSATSIWVPFGQFAATEVSNLLQGHGKVAAVLFDTRKFGMQGQVGAFDAFKQAIQSNHGVTLAGETILQPVKPDKGGIQFPGQQVQALAQRHAGADLIVCFGGAPFVDVAKLDWDKSRNPRLVSVLSFTAEQMRDLFTRQILIRSIAPPQPTPAEVAPAIHEVSGLPIQVITPENAAAVFATTPQ